MPTVNRVIRNIFNDDEGTITVTESEYNALLSERREIEDRARPVSECEDVGAALADAERLHNLCLMFGDRGAARAAQERCGQLKHENMLRASRLANEEREYQRRLSACLDAAESVGRAYEELDSLIMTPEEVRGGRRATLTPAGLDGPAILAREGSERQALSECAALAAQCAGALESFEKPRPRGLADRLKVMLKAIVAAAEQDAQTARDNLATIERESADARQRWPAGAAPPAHARPGGMPPRPRAALTETPSVCT